MSRYECSKLTKYAAIANVVIQGVTLVPTLLLIASLCNQEYLEMKHTFVEPQKLAQSDVSRYKNDKMEWSPEDLEHFTNMMTFLEGQKYVERVCILWFSILFFILQIILICYSASKLLEATQPEITIEEAKRIFKLCQSSLKKIAVLCIITAVIYMCRGELLLAALHILPPILQSIAMLPMLFELGEPENLGNLEEGEKTKEFVTQVYIKNSTTYF